MPRAGILSHFNRLLRRAMRIYPRLISADRHNCQFIRAFVPQATERIGHRGVSAKYDFATFPADDVAIVTAIIIDSPAGAPMLNLEGLYFQIALRSADAGSFIPTKGFTL